MKFCYKFAKNVLMEMKANNWEELHFVLDRTLKFVIGFWALHDGYILHFILGPSNETFECLNLRSNHIQ